MSFTTQRYTFIISFALAFILWGSPYSLVRAQDTCANTTCTNAGSVCEMANGQPTCVQTTPDEIVVTAQKTAAPAGPTFATVVQGIVGFFNSYIIPLLYALAFIYFVAGLVRYFFIGQGEEAQEKGKQMAIYGLIGLVVLFGVWGIVNVVLGTITSITGVSTS